MQNAGSGRKLRSRGHPRKTHSGRQHSYGNAFAFDKPKGRRDRPSDGIANGGRLQRNPQNARQRFGLYTGHPHRRLGAHQPKPWTGSRRQNIQRRGQDLHGRAERPNARLQNQRKQNSAFEHRRRNRDRRADALPKPKAPHKRHRI